MVRFQSGALTWAESVGALLLARRTAMAAPEIGSKRVQSKADAQTDCRGTTRPLRGARGTDARSI